MTYEERQDLESEYHVIVGTLEHDRITGEIEDDRTRKAMGRRASQILKRLRGER